MNLKEILKQVKDGTLDVSQAQDLISKIRPEEEENDEGNEDISAEKNEVASEFDNFQNDLQGFRSEQTNLRQKMANAREKLSKKHSDLNSFGENLGEMISNALQEALSGVDEKIDTVLQGVDFTAGSKKDRIKEKIQKKKEFIQRFSDKNTETYNSCSNGTINLTIEKICQVDFPVGIVKIFSNNSSNEIEFKFSGKNLPTSDTDIKYQSEGDKVLIWLAGAKQLKKHSDAGIECELELKVPESLHLIVETISADLETEDLKNKIDFVSVSGNIQAEDVEGELSVKSTSGDAEIENHKGQIKISTTSGDCNMNDCKGPVEISTKSGDSNFKDCVGKITVDTLSGDIDLIGCSGSFKVETTSGDITVDYQEGSINAKSSSGDITFDAEKGISGDLLIFLNSTSGDVTATIPKTSSAVVEVKSMSGDVSMSGDDLTYKQTDGRTREIKLNQGEAKVIIQSMSGDIDLEIE